MKKINLAFLLLFLCANTIIAQHKGNYNQITQDISRQNILTSGNANIYNPTVQHQMNKTLHPSDVLTIDVKALQNVSASTYTAIFNLSQIGETAESTNALMKERIDNIKTRLNALGITEKDFAIDVISFVPVYEVEVTKNYSVKHTLKYQKVLNCNRTFISNLLKPVNLKASWKLVPKVKFTT